MANLVTSEKILPLIQPALKDVDVDIEQNDIGEIIGVQDQCASAFGGLVHIQADKEGIKPKRFLVRKEYQNYIHYSGYTLQKNVQTGYLAY